MYDLIGDIHGHANELKRLLIKLGYRSDRGVWSHAERKVIFLGDFIDRGPNQLETVNIAKTMVEAGNAYAVMGNHEFNAVAWATRDPDRSSHYLREHSAKNRQQHQVYLDQAGEGSHTHSEHIEWFKKLPLYLEFEGLRVVHACWHTKSIAILNAYLDEQNCLFDHAWSLISAQETSEYDAMETILKGLELPLPIGIYFFDKDGNVRRHIRTRWWEAQGATYRDVAMVPAEVTHQIPDQDIPQGQLLGYLGDKPLFIGHYWLTGIPQQLTPHLACLDYSIAGENVTVDNCGKLCAYRWHGEKVLNDDHFFWVER